MGAASCLEPARRPTAAQPASWQPMWHDPGINLPAAWDATTGSGAIAYDPNPVDDGAHDVARSIPLTNTGTVGVAWELAYLLESPDNPGTTLDGSVAFSPGAPASGWLAPGAYETTDIEIGGLQESSGFLWAYDFATRAGANTIYAWSDENRNGVLDDGDLVGFYPDVVWVSPGAILPNLDFAVSQVVGTGAAAADLDDARPTTAASHEGRVPAWATAAWRLREATLGE